MPVPRDPSMLLAAARLYYVEGRSQAEIAQQMQTSRSNVSRMLSEALRQGIVEIRIHDPGGRVADLEHDLERRLGLRDVRVAHGGPTPGLRVEDRVGTQAARLLLDILKDGMTVALSWGHALQAMVYATVADQEHHRITLVQLVGGLSSISNEISGQELVRELAVRLGAEYRFLHAPAVVGSRTARDALLAEPSISDALAQARRADIAFVGIGNPRHGSSAAIVSAFNLSPAELEEFRAAQPVGDIAARYYDAEGAPIDTVASERVIGVALDELANIPQVVGLAHGRAKAASVQAAVRGGLIDSLVCDEPLARALLSETAPTTPDSPDGPDSPQTPDTPGDPR